MIMHTIILSLLLSLSSAICFAQKPAADDNDLFFKKLYHSQAINSNADMAKRLKFFSGYFLGKPYLLGALGEGKNAPFDQSPLYRCDAFDCETYVDTVLALALAPSFQDFQQCINQVRYQGGKVDFLRRNHFTGLDWDTNNQQQGFIKDITKTIKGKQQQSIYVLAKAWIDKPNWYKHLSKDRVRLFPEDTALQAKQLMALRQLGAKEPVQEEIVPFLPFHALFDEHDKPRKEVFAQIPDAAIVNIVRANWELKKLIGTNLNISHLGFVFWSKGELMFRNASSLEGKVVEVPLVNYLKEARKSPTITGINVQVVVPKRVLKGCGQLPLDAGSGPAGRRVK